MKNLKIKIITCLFFFAVLLALTIKAEAQTEIGLRIMPTISSFEMTSSDGNRVSGGATLGYGIGGLLGFNTSEHVGFQLEFIYNSLSQKYVDRTYERKVNLDYINFPLLLSLNTGKTKPVNLNFVIGPQFGLSVGSSVTTTGGDGSSNTEAVVVVKKGDFGFAYGAGLDFGILKNIRLGVGFRGVFGLVDISDRSQTAVTNSYFVLEGTHIKTYSGYIGLSFLF